MPKEIYKTYHHVPPHLYRPRAKYFITASTYNSERILSDKAKDRLLSSMVKGCSDYGWVLEDVHRFTALWIKRNIPSSRRLPHVFQNYWDTCITYETSYFARLNYIYHNPVKHGYVNQAEEYIHGSYRIRICEKGEKEELMAMKQKYPFDGINVKDEL